MARIGYKDVKVYLQKKFLYINCGMVCYLHGSNYDSVFPINTGLKVINIEELYTSQGNSAGDTGSFITFEVNNLDTAFNTYQTNFLLLGIEDITSTVLSIISQLLNQSLPQLVENSIDSLAEIKKLTTGDETQDGLIKQIIDKLEHSVEPSANNIGTGSVYLSGDTFTLRPSTQKKYNVIKNFVSVSVGTTYYNFYLMSDFDDPIKINGFANIAYKQSNSSYESLYTINFHDNLMQPLVNVPIFRFYQTYIVYFYLTIEVLD